VADLYLSINYEKFNSYDVKRRNYIIKNFIKSYILYYISIVTIPIVPIVLFNMANINKCLHFLGFLYCTNDTVALFKNMNMSYSTKIHHIISTTLSIINIFVDSFRNDDIPKLMGLYYILSCYPYEVNYCLGMRFLLERSEEKKMKRRAFIKYLGCCFINWSIHSIYLLYNITNLNIVMVSYYSLIVFIVYDDIILINWLRN
jgi:hypothetical protein